MELMGREVGEGREGGREREGKREREGGRKGERVGGRTQRTQYNFARTCTPTMKVRIEHTKRRPTIGGGGGGGGGGGQIHMYMYMQCAFIINATTLLGGLPVSVGG